MAKRPGHECFGCGHEWSPRGHDRAARCPECKSTSINVVREPALRPPPATAVPLVLGCGLIVLVLGCVAIAIGALSGRRAEGDGRAISDGAPQPEQRAVGDKPREPVRII